MTEETKERKTRRDKGLIMATTRDLACLTWIGEMYAARVDQVRRLISRYPDPRYPFKGSLIAETTLKDQVNRWERAGWVEYCRVLSDEPGYVWLTSQGLAVVGLSHYTARQPAATRLDHIYAVNQVRLDIDTRHPLWKSERCYRAEQAQEFKGKTMGVIPDGLVYRKNWIAIEVELSLKKPADLSDKIERLVRKYVPLPGVSSGFPEIYFFVQAEGMKEAIVAAMSAAKLEPDEQRRIKISVLSKEMLSAKYRKK